MFDLIYNGLSDLLFTSALTDYQVFWLTGLSLAVQLFFIAIPFVFVVWLLREIVSCAFAFKQ